MDMSEHSAISSNLCQIRTKNGTKGCGHSKSEHEDIETDDCWIYQCKVKGCNCQFRH